MPDRPPHDGLDPDLLDRYLAGECSEAEAVVVRRWMMAHPDAARRLAEYLARLDDELAAPPPPTVAASWAAIQARVDAETPVGAHPSPTTAHDRRQATRAAATRRLTRRRIGALAAAACAVLAAGLGYVASRERVPAARVTAPLTYTTHVRERSDLRLSDGTRVRLAPGSRLRVATDFGVERRDVYLDGEGYFEVVHDAARPFTVYAGNTSVRDIGTAFSVRGYAADSAVQVVVREGEVALAGVGRLVAGDAGRVAATGQTKVMRNVAVDSLLSWTAGRLVYGDAPLRLVLQDLRRWYGVDVQLADTATAALLFTGALADVAPEEAVEQVAATLGLDLRREGDRLVLAPNPRKTPQAPQTP
jgi:transmembrane sensor